ncbi:hypothetical protein RI046_18190 [Herbaspirillum huttiense subsp. nephrolepidis]|uniref:Uncharacterized protein n=2 Tax=Herbaspirillum huttiense TaxID=863372 RepID=A0AAJ2H6B8_9BURK|nr:hypothetical protein [Herbaspirillum huttiense]
MNLVIGEWIWLNYRFGAMPAMCRWLHLSKTGKSAFKLFCFSIPKARTAAADGNLMFP